MATRSRPKNPFFVLLVLTGIAFSITAFAYFVMARHSLQGDATDPVSNPGLRLLAFLDERGVTLMMVELALLAFFTLTAIGTDNYWCRRAERKSAADGQPNPAQEEQQ